MTAEAYSIVSSNPDLKSIGFHFMEHQAFERREELGFALFVPKSSHSDMIPFEVVNGSFDEQYKQQAATYQTPRKIIIFNNKISFESTGKENTKVLSDGSSLFEAAFLKCIRKGECAGVIREMYESISSGLQSLKVESVVIDTCIHREEIEFKMNLGQGLYVSAFMNKDMFGENVVEFTIAVDGEMLVVNTMQVDELCATLEEIQKDFASL